MSSTNKSPAIKVYRSVPWLIASCALLSSVACLTTGIIILATWNTPGDISLGILTLVFAVWGIAGSIVALVLLVKQNRLNRSQADFIAQVSHELRTPLTSIKMFSETLALKRYRDEEEEAQLFDSLNSEIRRVEQLTEQIFEFRPTNRTIPKEALSVSNAMIKILAPFQQRLESKDRIHFELIDPLPLISVNFEDLDNAVSNLIQNALTHGGPGHVYIRVFSHEKGVSIEVRDEGPGVDEKLQKVIFEPFERGEQTTDSGIPGFGIGLSIVKKFTKTYKSKISIANHPEGGAIFTLWIKEA